MEANEIRVGNWLIDPRPLTEFNKKYLKNPNNGYFKATYRDIGCAELFEPIPLTEEILLKCGFKKTWYGYENKEIEIDRDEKDELKLSVNCNEYTIGNPFKYLHQLQNLYFALTGQELEINL